MSRRTRSHAAIIDYLIAFGMSRILESDTASRFPRTAGGSVGFVSVMLGGGKAIPGDLIRLESAPASKWRLSWLKEVKPAPGGDCSYLCESVVDGELCWWSNVSVGYLLRQDLENHPEWRWTDEQYEFNDKWIKACKKHDPYMYLPLSADFSDDGTALVGTRVRHGINEARPVRSVPNWRKVTLKALSALYLDMVAEHKTPKAL